MKDILRQALVNELDITLKEWDELNIMAQNNQWINKGKLDYLRIKITDLCRRLDYVNPFFYPTEQDNTKHGG